MVVVVGGTTLSRTANAPGANEYRVRTQTVIGVVGTPLTDWLPILEFNASRNGQTGTVDYYAVGTRLTVEFVESLMDLLTPLVGVLDLSTLETTYAASSSLTAPGRPGRIAFLQDGTMFYSDGIDWVEVAGNVAPSEWQALMVNASGFGLASTSAFAAAWTAARSQAHTFGISSTFTYNPGGVQDDRTQAHTFAIAAVSAFAASWTSARSQAVTFSMAQADSYTPPAGGSAPTFVGAGAVSWRANSGNLTPALPTGLQQGDLMVLLKRGSSQNAPSGWTVHDSTPLLANICYKVAGASESAPTTSTTQAGGAVILAFRGGAWGSIPSGSVESQGSGAVVVSSVTTPEANCLILVFTGGQDDGATDGEGNWPNTSPHWNSVTGTATSVAVEATYGSGNILLGLAAYYATVSAQGSSGTTTVEFDCVQDAGSMGKTTGARTLIIEPA
jgi:hypothetical protein